MRIHRTAALLVAISLVAAACGDDDAVEPTSSAVTSASTTTPAPATTVATTTTAAPAPTTATTQAATTTEAPARIEIGADKVVIIDWDGLGGVFFAPPVSGSTDPFFHVHNQPATDGFFLSIEAYTTYGTAWTGELGTFEIDCSPSGSGICVHFDPDGSGPIGDLGADFLAAGSIEIIQADADGFRAIVSGLIFTDGTSIPGPLTITG